MFRIFGCNCGRPPFNYKDFRSRDVGEDDRGATVEIQTCRSCDKQWLVYLIEEPHFTRSGRWWRIQISSKDTEELTPSSARRIIEAQQWCFVGGSFYDQEPHKKYSPISVA